MADVDLFGSDESQHSEGGKSNNASSAESEAEKSEHSASEEQSGGESDKEDDRHSGSGESHHSRSPTPPVASGSELDEPPERVQSDADEHSGASVAAEESGSENSDAESARSASVHSRDGAESPAAGQNAVVEQNGSDDGGHSEESEGHVSEGEENRGSDDEVHSEGKPAHSGEDEDEKKSQPDEDKQNSESEAESVHESVKPANSDQEMSAGSDGEIKKKSPKRKAVVSSDEEEVEENEVPKKKTRLLSDGDISAEEGEEEPSAPKKKTRILSDGDISDEEGEGQKATATDLFGDDIGDVSSDEDNHASAAAAKGTPEEKPDDDEDRGPMDIVDRDNVLRNEDDPPEVEEPVPETRIEVEIPRIATNLGNEIHFVKLPNFLSLDTRPYDPQLYEDEIDEDELLDEEGRARMKLKVENTMRWRYGCDELGNPKKESNARMVKWSDGSLSLHLGSEIFDVHKQSLMVGDHNHLFIRQGTGLQGQAVFKTKLSFRPHSTDSFTHRKMTLSLADRSQKTQKIRVLPTVGKDPEAHRSEMIKKEEDKLKASIRRENKQRRIREKSHGRGLSASYLEPDRDDDDDDDGAISLAAIKNKYKKGGAALKEKASIYSSDEESGEEEREKRLEQAKNIDEDEDSDLDYFDKKKASADGKKKTAMIEDSEDDD